MRGRERELSARKRSMRPLLLARRGATLNLSFWFLAKPRPWCSPRYNRSIPILHRPHFFSLVPIFRLLCPLRFKFSFRIFFLSPPLFSLRQDSSRRLREKLAPVRVEPRSEAFIFQDVQFTSSKIFKCRFFENTVEKVKSRHCDTSVTLHSSIARVRLVGQLERARRRILFVYVQRNGTLALTPTLIL